MRRALPIAAVAVILASVPAIADADCAQDIAAMRTRLASLDDQAKHRELELLLDKAQEDSKSGRAELCAEDLRHAEALVK